MPAQVVPGQAVKTAPQQAKRGLLQPVSYTTTMQPPAGTVAPAPAPVVVGQPAPLAPLDLTTAPAVPEMTEAPIYESHMYRAWGKAEYLLWRFGSVLLPTFQADVASGNVVVFRRLSTVDTSTNPATIINTDQAINLPVNVSVDVGLPGGQSADLRDQPGYRVTAGWWVDSNQEWGWEASYFWLWNRDVGFTNGLNLIGQTVQLAQEFDQTQTTVVTTPGGDSNSQTITSPLFVSADVNVTLVGRAASQIWGVEANARRRLAYFGPAVFDLIGGVRFIKIKQETSVFESIVISPTAGAGQGTVVFTNGQPTGIANQPADQLFPSTATLLGTVSTVIFDSIAVKNDYYLAQIGGSFEWDVSERFYVAGYGKLGFGGVRQSASLVGLRNQTFTPAQAGIPAGFNGIGGSGTAAAVTGGLLVSPQDNGVERTVDRIAFVPEANISVGWRATPGLSFLVGYNVIHFSNVAKVNNITTDAPVTTTVRFGREEPVARQSVQPGFRFGGDKSNLQGLSLAAEFRY
ncbi:MAG: BBP7 family outer membrane beta-barrel protein [Planctomycetia bacterium]|nr:BBP7 family outer membrane beta-barrel protein [Planctomycetia bacterium]